MNVYYYCLVLWLFTHEVSTFPNKLFFSSSSASNRPGQTSQRNHRTVREVEEAEPDFEIIDLSLPSWDDVLNCIDCEDSDVISRHVLSQKRMERLSVRPLPMWSLEQSGSGDGDTENAEFNEDLDDQYATMQTTTEESVTSNHKKQHFKSALGEARHVDKLQSTPAEAMNEFVFEASKSTENPPLQENSSRTESITTFSELKTGGPKILKDSAEETIPAQDDQVTDETEDKNDHPSDVITNSPLITEDSTRTVSSNQATDGVTEAVTPQFTTIFTNNEEPMLLSTAVTPNYCNISKENVFVRLYPTSVTVEEGHNATIECQVFLNALSWPEPFIEWRFTSPTGHKCSLGPRSYLYDTCSWEETRTIELKNTSMSVLSLQMLTTNQTGLYECSVSWDCHSEVTKGIAAQAGNVKRVETQQSLLLKVYAKPYYVYQISAISGLGILLLGLLAAFCFLKNKNTKRTKVLYSVQSTECEDVQVTKAVLEKKESQFSQASFVSDEEDDDEGD